MESRFAVFARTGLIVLAVVLGVALFVGAIVGVEAIRVARMHAADRNWRPPASAVTEANASVALPPAAAATKPIFASIVEPLRPTPQRIALWAQAAKLSGGGVMLMGKRDRVVTGWTSPSSRAAWTLDDAVCPGRYYVDVTYSTDREDGGSFLVDAAPETLYAVAQRTAGRNTFTTVRMGTIILSPGASTLVIRPGEILPKRSLMSLERVDLRPVGDPESESAPVVTLGQTIQNVGALATSRDRRAWRPNAQAQAAAMAGGGGGAAPDPRSLLSKLLRPGEKPVEPTIAALELVDADRGTVVRPLTDGEKLDLRSLPRHLTIAATVAGPVQSVRFEWSVGNRKENHLENNPPYAMAGDTNGKYLSANLGAGTYRLTVSPFMEADAKGRKGPPLSLSFTLSDGK